MRLTVATDGGWLREFRADGAGLAHGEPPSGGSRRLRLRTRGARLARLENRLRVSRDVAEIAARHLAPPSRPE